MKKCCGARKLSPSHWTCIVCVWMLEMLCRCVLHSSKIKLHLISIRDMTRHFAVDFHAPLSWRWFVAAEAVGERCNLKRVLFVYESEAQQFYSWRCCAWRMQWVRNDRTEELRDEKWFACRFTASMRCVNHSSNQSLQSPVRVAGCVCVCLMWINCDSLATEQII